MKGLFGAEPSEVIRSDRGQGHPDPRWAGDEMAVGEGGVPGHEDTSKCGLELLPSPQDILHYEHRPPLPFSELARSTLCTHYAGGQGGKGQGTSQGHRLQAELSMALQIPPGCLRHPPPSTVGTLGQVAAPFTREPVLYKPNAEEQPKPLQTTQAPCQP